VGIPSVCSVSLQWDPVKRFVFMPASAGFWFATSLKRVADEEAGYSRQ
jgi:hypothetical protein